MNTLVILSLLLTASLVGVAIWRHKELPESISALVYDLPKKRQWVWSAWLVAVSALLFVPLTDACGGLGWLTEACLMGAALTPLVKQDTRKWHYVFGIAAGILSQVCVAVTCIDCLSVWMAFVFVMLSVYVQPDGKLAKAVEHKGAFVAEVIATVGVDLSLLIFYN